MSSNDHNVLTINYGAIAKNYQLIRQNLQEGTECAAVIKADAYGLGMINVAKTLSYEGCSKFFVATIDEASKLREVSLTDDIYVLYGLKKGQESLFYLQNLIPVLNSFEQAELWSRFAKRKGTILPAILAYDTGMNRTGMSCNEIYNLLQSEIVNDIKILYILSHLACADINDHPLNDIQYNKIIKLREKYPDLPISLANSAGIFLDKKYHFDMVRPGAALYGMKTSNLLPKLNNVISLNSSIIQIRTTEEDCTVGYGATYNISKGSKIATIAMGYADGMLRYASNRGFCYIADVKVPIIGRVSMDSFVVDVTKVEDRDLYVGAEVEIIGDNCSIEDVAEYLSTINYEVLLNLKGRMNRVLVNLK